MQNSMLGLTFSVLHRKQPFLNSLDEKKFFTFMLNLDLDLFEYAEFNSAVNFFCFRQETYLFVQIWSKKKNCYFKFKLSSYTNSNVPNSKVVLSFSVLDGKHPFFSKFGPKIKKYQFKLKFSTQTNSDIQIE